MKVNTVKITNSHNPPHAMINMYLLNIDGIDYNYSYPNHSSYPHWTALEEAAYIKRPGDTGYTRNLNRQMWTLRDVIVPIDKQNPTAIIKKFFQLIMLQ